MSTLRAVTDPRAWEMRHQVVDDCKEAIDSIAYLDTPEAWALRERHLDRWPSTVAKTLGPLALGQRGGDMIARLLHAHPYNISLLKHAAGVALGVVQKESFEEP
jgi:dTMP kinase